MESYYYTECGLKNVYLKNGFKVTKNTDGEEEISIQDIHGLHKAIGIILISKAGVLSGDEVRFIRHTMDLSQTDLATILGIDYQSVLGWEKEKRKIPKTPDRLLRVMFFSYLEKNSPVYELINEIANRSAENVNKKPIDIYMKIFKQEWQYENKAA